MAKKHSLEMRGLHAGIAGKEIIKGVDLTVSSGEIHALMGPNGSGKSTLSYLVMGHPGYEVTSGDILFDGESILDLSPDERCKKGLFLSFQYPLEIPGVSLSNFLRTAYNSVRPKEQHMPPFKFETLLQQKLAELHMSEKFSERSVNEGFSGGEKKRCEILQMAVLGPKIALMDETDSGLDIDALKIVSEGTKRLKADTGMGVLLITHYQRILRYVRPDFVHVFVDGRIVKSGRAELAELLEAEGYAKFLPASKLELESA